MKVDYRESIGYQFSIGKEYDILKHLAGEHDQQSHAGEKIVLIKFEFSQISEVVKAIDKWLSEQVENYAKLSDGIGTYENKIVWRLKDGRLVVVRGDLEAKKPSQWIEEVPTYVPYKSPPKTAYEMSSARSVLMAF